eukprot:5329281-Prymnesium_polylepis.1
MGAHAAATLWTHTHRIRRRDSPDAQTSRRPDACQTPARRNQTRPDVPDARAQPVRDGGVWIWCVQSVSGIKKTGIWSLAVV